MSQEGAPASGVRGSLAQHSAARAQQEDSSGALFEGSDLTTTDRRGPAGADVHGGVAADDQVRGAGRLAVDLAVDQQGGARGARQLDRDVGGLKLIEDRL